jgi:hypothetical protein
VLGLSISLKVYTIFFLFYFAFKREYKAVIWTVIFITVLNALSFMIFGIEEAIANYHQWIVEIAPRSYIAHHKNQSLFGAFLRLFTGEYPGIDLYTNVLSIESSTVKKLIYLFVALAAVIPAYLFRKKLSNATSTISLLEFSLIFTLVPLLSPLAWKYYFIFLWFPYLLAYALLFRSNISLSGGVNRVLKSLFFLSIFLNVLTSDLFLGVWLSDVTECFSFITFGTIILLVIQFYLTIKARNSGFKFELK